MLFKILFWISTLIVSFLGGYFASGILRGMRPQIVELDEPLEIINPSGTELDSTCFLPKGTTLYYDTTDKSSTRYQLYIDLYGPPFETHVPEKKWFIAPLSASRE